MCIKSIPCLHQRVIMGLSIWCVFWCFGMLLTKFDPHIAPLEGAHWATICCTLRGCSLGPICLIMQVLKQSFFLFLHNTEKLPLWQQVQFNSAWKIISYIGGTNNIFANCTFSALIQPDTIIVIHKIGYNQINYQKPKPLPLGKVDFGFPPDPQNFVSIYLFLDKNKRKNNVIFYIEFLVYIFHGNVQYY